MRRHRRGSLLMVTLWLVAALSLLAVAISHRLSLELRLVKHQLAAAQAQALARGAVRYGTALLQADLATDAYDWLGDEWAGTVSDTSGSDAPAGDAQDEPVQRILLEIADGAQPSIIHRVALRIVDEERRLNLNAADPSHLMGLGLSDSSAQALIEYRNPDEPDDPREDRLDLTPPYIAKDAPLASVHEVAAIPALQEARDQLAVLLQEGTVYTDGRLNINTVSLPVLMAVNSGAAPDTILEELVARRAGADGTYGTLDDCLLRDDAEAVQNLAVCLGKGFDEVSAAVGGFSFSSVVFRVIAEPLDDEGVPRHHVEAIVTRAQTPLVIVGWIEG